MSRWRFINNWKPFGGYRTFVLFHFWWGNEFIGVGALNFAIEYQRIRQDLTGQ